MLKVTLLSAHQNHMRVYALDMAVHVYLPVATHCTRSAMWLLDQLATMRPHVAANADRCCDFYSLFSQVGPVCTAGDTTGKIGDVLTCFFEVQVCIFVEPRTSSRTCLMR